jgi:hypothetical protein
MTAYDKTRIQFRKGTAAEFSAVNPVLSSGEPAYAVDTKVFKIGDGVSNWNNLLSALWEDDGDVVFSNTSGIVGASGVNNIVIISQSNYNNIVSPDPNTVYYIV